MSRYLFYTLMFVFSLLSIAFLVIAIINIDALLLTISVLFAVCALLLSLENKVSLSDPFTH